MKLYENIRKRRQELGMTQEELAKKLGYKNKSTIAKIESGARDLSVNLVEEFAHALNTTVESLVREDFTMPKDEELKVMVEIIKELPPDHVKVLTAYVKTLSDMNAKAPGVPEERKEE